MARVIAISIGDERGMAKKPVSGATLHVARGVEGDATASSKRQVTILLAGDIEAADMPGPPPGPGDFGENLIIDGLEFDNLSVSTRLEVGPTILEITGIGLPDLSKIDASLHVHPLVVRRGIFARVVKGGWVSPGENVRLLEKD